MSINPLAFLKAGGLFFIFDSQSVEITRIVQEQAQQFINDLFGKLRERMIDLRSGKAVFVGGGSILLKKQIEASGKVSTPIFVDEISANTKGYELLFKAACMG